MVEEDPVYESLGMMVCRGAGRNSSLHRGPRKHMQFTFTADTGAAQAALPIAEEFSGHEYEEIERMGGEDIYDDVCKVREVASRLQGRKPEEGERRRFISEVGWGAEGKKLL